jgi:hypothetical protein
MKYKCNGLQAVYLSVWNFIFEHTETDQPPAHARETQSVTYVFQRVTVKYMYKSSRILVLKPLSVEMNLSGSNEQNLCSRAACRLE